MINFDTARSTRFSTSAMTRMPSSRSTLGIVRSTQRWKELGMFLSAGENNIEKLFQLASELKVEVEKTDSVQVLSVPLLKKAEEIEKLAKSIRSRAIG